MAKARHVQSPRPEPMLSSVGSKGTRVIPYSADQEKGRGSWLPRWTASRFLAEWSGRVTVTSICMASFGQDTDPISGVIDPSTRRSPCPPEIRTVQVGDRARACLEQKGKGITLPKQVAGLGLRLRQHRPSRKGGQLRANASPPAIGQGSPPRACTRRRT